MLWLLGPSGVEFSEDVDSWRVRGLWRDECMLARVGQGLLESRNSLGEAGGQETGRFRRLLTWRYFSHHEPSIYLKGPKNECVYAGDIPRSL